MESGFSKEALEEAYKLAELQRLLSSMNEENFNSTVENIMKLPYIKTIDGVYFFVHELMDVFEIRSTNQRLHARLFGELNKNAAPDNALEHLKPIILKAAFRPYGKALLHRKEEALCFIRNCLMAKVLTINEIAEKICNILSDCIFETAENSLLYFFFGAELEAFDPPLFTLLSQKTNRHNNPLEEFIDTLDLLCADGWEKMHDFTDVGCTKDSPFYAIHRDDPSLWGPDLNINQKFPNLFFQPRFIYERTPNLIQLACFYGAINCVKELIKRGASLKNTEKYAVAGANPEVLQILKDKGLSLLRSIKIAARFRRYELFEQIYKQTPFGVADQEYEALSNDEALTIDGIFNKCARTNNVVSMLFVLKNGATPTKWNASGMIMIAADEGHVGVLKLLASIPGIEAPGISKGTTALFQAAENGHLGSLKVIMGMKGADCSFRKGSRTILHAAALNGHQDVVQYIIDNNCVDINSVDASKRTPLYFAIDGCYINVIRAFLNSPNCDTNHKDVDGLTALHSACKSAPSSIVRFLVLSGKFDINAKDKQGNTPFHYAASRETMAIAESLSQNSNQIDYNSKNKQGNTPLHLAAQTLSRAITFVVSCPGIDYNAVNKDGMTPLHLACKRNRPESVQSLVQQQGIELNKHDAQNKTALAIASKMGFIDVVKILVKTPGIDPNDGNPLYEAAVGQWPDVVIALTSCKGIDVEQKGPDGNTALEVVNSNEAKIAIREVMNRK
ncbi:hypothetical protein TVAG_238810 [Trichomonas vaginalis G3]|uniref:Uncharacterized protein n=1 Tax=Trichomonas vaginalis (strain ATCC PRA-98 / G3) TaxID=412133 RepID=A2DGB3_TRIV3|nr:spectrin binding [Trichomonas vaginalis G3]EAY20509.1 hypothetical protein TVAG_238810 [Trichomonas vaginalis G3]KAI5488315.1 spectrin binding [Trichomonas vaginalis G3]|eukprot:XP_001581495.1 hypothetical protein [Trichomonas vaginalis G3]